MRHRPLNSLASLLLCLVLLPAAALAEVGPAEMEKAREAFRRFVLLEQSYNPDVVDFYADGAVIVTRVILPGGERDFRTTGADFKQALAPYLVTARNIGEWFAYTNITVLPEGDGVRVLASRTSKLTDETYPYQALFRRGPGGRWIIYEERSVVRPADPQ